MGYKVGDKVRVRQWDDMAKEFGECLGAIDTPFCFFVSSMKVYCGLVYEIAEVYGRCYELKSNEKLDIKKWYFTDDMLESVASPSLKTPKTQKESEKKEIETEIVDLIRIMKEQGDSLTCKYTYEIDINEEDVDEKMDELVKQYYEENGGKIYAKFERICRLKG